MFVSKLVKLYKIPYIRRVAFVLIKMFGCEISVHAKIGNHVKFVHDAPGTVIHEKAVIGDYVKIYQGVTIGRGNIWEEPAEDFEGFIVEEGAVLCAGAKILCTHGKLIIGTDSIVGANTVLTHSIGPSEIWGGV